MTRLQYITIGSVLVLFLILYLACDTKPPRQRQIEKSRALMAEATDIDNLIKEAQSELTPDQISTLQVLEQELQNAEGDSARIAVYKQLSSRWYASGQVAIAGHYAQQIADLNNTEEAWSIAGTTYAICVQRTDDPKVKTYCQQRAISAYENAISLNPDNVSHKVNLALSYTEMPPENEPMKGVLMLREIQGEYPENVLVLNTLARLAIQTGQYERATQRLEQALAIEPDNTTTICLLGQAYTGAGDAAKAQAYVDRCQQAN